MEFPEPVIQVAIEPKTKAGQEKMSHGAADVWPKKTRPSRPTPTRRPARPSSPAWASCIWRSSLTVCCASSRSRRPSARRRLPIERPSARRPRPKAVTSVRPAVTASTVTAGSSSIPTEPGEGYAFEQRHRRRRDSRRNSFAPIDARYPRGGQERPAGRLRGCGLQGHAVSTAPTTRSTPPKWRSRSPVPWRSRMRWQKADPVLLEPIMKVEVIVPDEYMGDVIGDLTSRRGRIEGMEHAARRAADRRASFRCPRCSVTPPTCVPAPRAAACSPCSSSHYEQVPQVHRGEGHAASGEVSCCRFSACGCEATVPNHKYRFTDIRRKMTNGEGKI